MHGETLKFTKRIFKVESSTKKYRA